MNHYFKDVQTLKAVDVYRVLVLFDVKSHPIGHAVKKLLCAGKRGAKDYRQDLIEAKASIERELAMMDEEEPMMCGEKWLETGNPFVGDDMSESQIEWLKAENARLMKENEQLMKDVHRIDAARQSAVSQCSVMAEEIEQLNEDVKSLKAALSEVHDD